MLRSDISWSFCGARCPAALAHEQRSWFVLQMYRWFPSILKSARIRSLNSGALASGRLSLLLALEVIGRAPQIGRKLRALIRRMSIDTHFGARRASTANYSSSALRRSIIASPNTWSSDVGRQARDGALFCITTADIAPWILFRRPTIGFKLLMLRHRSAKPQRPLSGSTHSKSDGRMVARQITEAFLERAPHYLIRDRDRSMAASSRADCVPWGIRDKPTAPGHPEQNGLWPTADRIIRHEFLRSCHHPGEASFASILRSTQLLHPVS